MSKKNIWRILKNTDEITDIEEHDDDDDDDDKRWDFKRLVFVRTENELNREIN